MLSNEKSPGLDGIPFDFVILGVKNLVHLFVIALLMQ
jgi:hypothetical protein